MSLESDIEKMLRDRFEGSPQMLESNFAGRDDFSHEETILMLARGQKDLREAILILAREVDNLARS